MKMPNFKDSNHALNFGLSFYGDKEVIAMLECYRENFIMLIDKMRELNIPDKQVLSMVFMAQFIREALEACRGDISFAYLKHINKNIRRNIAVNRNGLYW